MSYPSRERSIARRAVLGWLLDHFVVALLEDVRNLMVDLHSLLGGHILEALLLDGHRDASGDGNDDLNALGFHSGQPLEVGHVYLFLDLLLLGHHPSESLCGHDGAANRACRSRRGWFALRLARGRAASAARLAGASALGRAAIARGGDHGHWEFLLKLDFKFNRLLGGYDLGSPFLSRFSDELGDGNGNGLPPLLELGFRPVHALIVDRGYLPLVVLNFVGGEFVDTLLVLAFFYLHELLAFARFFRSATASRTGTAAAVAVGLGSSVPALKALRSLNPHDEVAGAALVHNLADRRLHLSGGRVNSNDFASTLYKV